MPIYTHQNSREGYGYDGSVKMPSMSRQKDQKPIIHYVEYESQPDYSPTTSLYPRSSVDTYDSTTDSQDDLALEREDDLSLHPDDYIPPLPSYTHSPTEPNVRPSTPKDFASLFPSTNRLSIRHDDFTSDGNMNLRVDTLVPGAPGTRTAVQLFHLRMYDLGKRDFSLRRYCRDSGREVCNSKRAPPASPPPTSRPALQRSMSSAMKTVLGSATKPAFRRQNSSTSTVSSGGRQQRPATSHSYETNADEASVSSTGEQHHKLPSQQQAQVGNAIKLEFSNYARVDVERKGSKGSKRYEFSWWGHRYTWKRVVEKHMQGVVSFHLMREGQAAPVAHIVPETRSPNQVEDDERAGGWVPPCYMWINDKSVLDAATDVAEYVPPPKQSYSSTFTDIIQCHRRIGSHGSRRRLHQGALAD